MKILKEPFLVGKPKEIGFLFDIHASGEQLENGPESRFRGYTITSFELIESQLAARNCVTPYTVVQYLSLNVRLVGDTLVR